MLPEAPTKDKDEGEGGLVVSANLNNLVQYLKEKAEADYEEVTHLISGVALDSAWSKHEAIIKASINSFAFTE